MYWLSLAFQQILLRRQAVARDGQIKRVSHQEEPLKAKSESGERKLAKAEDWTHEDLVDQRRVPAEHTVVRVSTQNIPPECDAKTQVGIRRTDQSPHCLRIFKLNSSSTHFQPLSLACSKKSGFVSSVVNRTSVTLSSFSERREAWMQATAAAKDAWEKHDEWDGSF